QLAISQDRLQRRELGVGAQDEDAIEARFLGKLAGVDLEDRLVLRLAGLAQVAAVGRAAYESVVASLELGLKRGDDRRAVGAVLLGLRFVATDHVALTIDLHFLDEQLRLARAALDQEGK